MRNGKEMLPSGAPPNFGVDDAGQHYTNENCWTDNAVIDAGLAPWSAVFVRPRHERGVAELLAHQGYENFLPMFRSRRTWSDRTKELYLPLFPTYVFCRLDRKDKCRIEKTPGVIRIVECAGEIAIIPESEISAIKRIAQCPLTIEPWEGLRCGAEVIVQAGPLSGLSGIIVQHKNHCKLIVSITLLNRAVSVELDNDVVRPV
jgi:transcription antitermination factor NusG